MKKRECINVSVDSRCQSADICQLCNRWHIGVKQIYISRNNNKKHYSILSRRTNIIEINIFVTHDNFILLMTE